MSVRDRLLTRRGAEAVTSPAAILLGAAGASATILLGAPAALAAAVGAVAWAGTVAARLPAGPARPDVRPDRLRDPWQRFVREAQDARARFDRAVAGARSGPLRQRLASIGDRMDDGVAECWRIASHGQDLEDALAQLDPPSRIQERLAGIERQLAGERAGDDRLSRTAEALRAQLASTERIARVALDTRERLQLLDARLDETVARAVELSLRATDAAAIGGLGSDVEDIVSEMEALRLALDETARPSSGAA